jgi:hypothetical protein
LKFYAENVVEENEEDKEESNDSSNQSEDYDEYEEYKENKNGDESHSNKNANKAPVKIISIKPDVANKKQNITKHFYPLFVITFKIFFLV